MKEINGRVIEQFRSGGPVEGMHRERLLLLTTVGRHTGQNRTTPMMFERFGDDVVVIASNVGAPTHPDWYLNLVAEPRVGVEIHTGRYDAVAATLSGDERSPVWTTIKEHYPFFADHEVKTTRTIPVVVLRRLGDPTGR